MKPLKDSFEEGETLRLSAAPCIHLASLPPRLPALVIAALWTESKEVASRLMKLMPRGLKKSPDMCMYFVMLLE